MHRNQTVKPTGLRIVSQDAHEATSLPIADGATTRAQQRIAHLPLQTTRTFDRPDDARPTPHRHRDERVDIARQAPRRPQIRWRWCLCRHIHAEQHEAGRRVVVELEPLDRQLCSASLVGKPDSHLIGALHDPR